MTRRTFIPKFDALHPGTITHYETHDMSHEIELIRRMDLATIRTFALLSEAACLLEITAEDMATTCQDSAVGLASAIRKHIAEVTNPLLELTERGSDRERQSDEGTQDNPLAADHLDRADSD